MSTTTAAPEATRTLREVIRAHLGPVVAVVDRLDKKEDITMDIGRAIGVLCVRARDQIVAFNEKHDDLESWEAEALAVSIGIMTQMANEDFFGESCVLDGPSDRGEAFTYMQTLTRMVKQRWLDG